MLSEKQKTIYNWFVRAQRINNNKPFRPRKNFDKFDEEKYLPDLIKIEKIFEKSPHLFRKEYFDAPYILHSKDKDRFLPLNYYSSIKGITACTSYFKLLQQQNPDEQLDFIRDSLKFIVEFCLKHKIGFYDYINYKTIAQKDCLKHLKQHYISWYVVLSFPGFLKLVQQMPNDEFTLYFGSDIDLNNLISRWSESIIARPYLEKKLKEMNLFVFKKLNSGSK
jgi:hypothetical protein